MASQEKEKRMQVFKEDYTEKYPVIIKSGRGPHYAFCKVCNSDFALMGPMTRVTSSTQ